LSYDKFIDSYSQIIQKCAKMLKSNRFACFVVGDVRDPKGCYRAFPADTMRAFEQTGMKLYNEAVLVTAVGSLPIRVGSMFGKYRKLGKTHQNVLCFYNGEPKAIAEEFPEIQVSELFDHEGGNHDGLDSEGVAMD